MTEAAKQAGRDLGNSLIGNTASAILKVYDYRGTQSKGDNTKGLEAMTAVLANGVAGEVAGQMAKEKIFHVQFNPSTLSMSASVAKEQTKSIEEGPDGQKGTLVLAVEKPRVCLTIRLIFDRVVNQDAFTSDKYLGTVSAATGSVIAADSLVRQGKGRIYSVQPEVEGIIAAIQNRFTRLISFHWGDFSFSGALEDVQAQYTMFSLSGRPIRANVTIRLVQTDASASLKNWHRDFNEAFNDGTADFTTASQKMGSIFNIPT